MNNFMKIMYNFWMKYVEPPKNKKIVKGETVKSIYVRYNNIDIRNISLLKVYLRMLSEAHGENLANDLVKEYERYVKDIAGAINKKIGDEEEINDLEDCISTVGAAQSLYDANSDYWGYDNLWELLKHTQEFSLYDEVCQYILEQEEGKYLGNIKYLDRVVESVNRNMQFVLELEEENRPLLQKQGFPPESAGVEGNLEDFLEGHSEELYSVVVDTWVLEEVGGDTYIFDGVNRLFVESSMSLTDKKLGSYAKPFWKRFIPKLIVRLRKELPVENQSAFWDGIGIIKRDWMLHLATLVALLPAIIEVYPHYYNYWVQWVGQPYRLYMKYYHGTDYVLWNMQKEVDFMLMGCKISYILLVAFLFYIMYMYTINISEIIKFLLRNETYFLIIGLYITLYYGDCIVRRREMKVEAPWRGYLQKIIYNADPYLPQKQSRESRLQWVYKDTHSIPYLLDWEFWDIELLNTWIHRYKYGMPGGTQLFTLDWLNLEGQRPLGMVRRVKDKYELFQKNVLKYVNIPRGFEEKEIKESPRDKYKWRLQQRHYYAKLKGIEEKRASQFRERMERQYMYYPDYYYMGEYTGNSIQFLDELESRNKLFGSYFRDAINMFYEHILLYPVKVNEFRDWYAAHKINAPYCPWNGNLRRVWQKEIIPQKFDGKRSMKYDYWFQNNVAYPYMEEVSDLQKQHIDLVEKRMRFAHWETEDLKDFIQTGSLNTDVTESFFTIGHNNMEPWLYGTFKLNIFKRYYYIMMESILSRFGQTWGKPMNRIPLLWTDLRRDRNAYRWRNEIEYGPSIYGSNIRDKYNYEMLLKNKILYEAPDSTLKFRRDFLRWRDTLTIENNLDTQRQAPAETSMYYAIEGLMEDLENMKEMGAVNGSQYRELKHWLLFDFGRDTTVRRNNILACLKYTQNVINIRKHNVWNTTFLGQRRKSFDKYKIDIFSWAQARGQQIVLGKRGRLELRRPLHNRFLMKSLNKNKRVIKEPYMEEATQNIFVSEKILPLLSTWKHDNKSFYNMLSALRVPISLNTDARGYIIKSPTRYNGFSSLDKLLTEGMGFQRWMHIKLNTTRFHYWRKRESILIRKLKAISHQQAMEWESMHNYMKNWIRTYERQKHEMCATTSIVDRIIELSRIFDNRIKISRRKRLIPSEGPAMGYYYKDMYKQNTAEYNVVQKRFDQPTFAPEGGTLLSRIYYYMGLSQRPVVSLYKQEYGKAIMEEHSREFMVKNTKIENLKQNYEHNNISLYGENKLPWLLNENKKIIKPLYLKKYVFPRIKMHAIGQGQEYGRVYGATFGENKEVLDKTLQIKEKILGVNKVLNDIDPHTSIERNYKEPTGDTNIMRRMSMKYIDSEAVYPWDLSATMLGSYGFKGGPVEMNTNNWAANYGGAHILRELKHMGRQKRWLIDDRGSFVRGSKANYTQLDFLKNWRNDDGIVTYLDEVAGDMENNFGIEKRENDLSFEKYRREAEIPIVGAYTSKKVGKLWKYQPPGAAEAYRDRSQWTYHRDATVYVKRNRKKYDYSFVNNPIPNEYYTVGREYWMPSKLYVEDIITDMDVINREIVIYEINRFLLLRYDWPLEIIIVNALNGFDLGLLNFMLF